MPSCCDALDDRLRPPTCWWMTTYHHTSAERAGDDDERHQRGSEVLDQHPVGDAALARSRSQSPAPARPAPDSSADEHVLGIGRLEFPHPVRHRHLGLLFRQLRRDLRINHRPADDVDEIEERQEEAGEHRGGIELHHRLPGHRRVDDDHHRRRNQNAERAARRDDAGGELHVVARLEHRVEGDDAHQHDDRADQAGGDAPERAHDQRRDRERGRHVPERELDRIEHLVDQRAALHHVSHQHEQRDRDQNVVGHRAVGALDHQVEDPVVGEQRASGRRTRCSRRTCRGPSA